MTAEENVKLRDLFHWAQTILEAGARQSDAAGERHAAATMRTVARSLHAHHPRIAAILGSQPSEVSSAAHEIVVEYLRARAIHRPFSTPHDGWAKMREELDELWDEVKKRDRSIGRMRGEALQVGAMALAFMLEVTQEEASHVRREEGSTAAGTGSGGMGQEVHGPRSIDY